VEDWAGGGQALSWLCRGGLPMRLVPTGLDMLVQPGLTEGTAEGGGDGGSCGGGAASMAARVSGSCGGGSVGGDGGSGFCCVCRCWSTSPSVSSES